MEIPQIVSVSDREIVVNTTLQRSDIEKLWMPIKKRLKKRVTMTYVYRDGATVLQFLVDFRSLKEEHLLLNEASQAMSEKLENYLFSYHNEQAI
ncbi:MAG: hypothetical protein LBQ02_03035 [Candidatus Nomurabacteria bacterium]|jgi:hypothetical protein|nr:hypothetical protein [Candidatus Nomurabacteria bacterium]